MMRTPVCKTQPGELWVSCPYRQYIGPDLLKLLVYLSLELPLSVNCFLLDFFDYSIHMFDGISAFHIEIVVHRFAGFSLRLPRVPHYFFKGYIPASAGLDECFS